MYLGVFCGTALVLSAYVSFAEAAADPSFRHMAPARFYLFIPFFAFWAFAIGIVAELIWFQRRMAPMRWDLSWFFLGLAYSGVWLPYGLAGVWSNDYELPLAYIAALLSAYLVHLVCGSPRRPGAA